MAESDTYLSDTQTAEEQFVLGCYLFCYLFDNAGMTLALIIADTHKQYLSAKGS